MKDFVNLETNRFKTCGYGKPLYNQDGHYDEVKCQYFNNVSKWCGDISCPLDGDDKEDDRDDEKQDYHGEDRGYE